MIEFLKFPSLGRQLGDIEDKGQIEGADSASIQNGEANKETRMGPDHQFLLRPMLFLVDLSQKITDSNRHWEINMAAIA